MSRKTLRTLILGLFLVVFIIPNQHALADVAPPEPPVGSDLSPGEEMTEVRMVSEYVVLSIHSDPDYSAGRADVSATFQMFNTGDEAEYMQVRFPLHHNYEELGYYGVTEGCGVYQGPPVENLMVWVDNEPVPVDISYDTMLDYDASVEANEDVYVTLPCWGHFNVIFPSQQTVNIKVTYQVSGYDYVMGVVEFMYLIGTGAGWKDTIESATIVARFPYPVSELNIKRCQPATCQISEWEVSWYFEDFEPKGLVSLETIRPSIWNQVIIEQERLELDPEDGEAWGRLAKAYKDSITGGRKGFLMLYTEYDQELFEMSFDAYQKATTLLPNDPDWHYGFADLIFRYLKTKSNLDNEESMPLWSECLESLKTTLDLDPEHQAAKDLLEGIDHLQNNRPYLKPIIDLSGPTPDFLLLTPVSDPTHTPDYPTPEESTPTPTREATPTPTREPSPTPTSTLRPSLTPTPRSPRSTPSSPTVETDLDVADQANDSVNVIVLVGIGGGISIILVYVFVKCRKEH